MSDYPDPTPEMLDGDLLFEAIWQAIKDWDISRHNDGLYSMPSGNDARHIYDAVKPRIEALESLGRINISARDTLLTRIEALEAALREIQRSLTAGNATYTAVSAGDAYSAWKIARAALDKDAGI